MFSLLRDAIFGRDRSVELPDAWFMQSGGSVYGPVPLSTLQEWAREGRVAPGCLVSPDRKVWHPAEELAPLEMDWLVDLPNGTQCGPINLHSLPVLIEEGTVSATATMTNVETGARSTVGAELSLVKQQDDEQTPAGGHLDAPSEE